mgnify:CR=1 FL=1
MKNKILALSAAILLAGGIAYGFSQSNGSCCGIEASSKCCEPTDECPVPCCEAGEASCKK